MWVFFHSEIYSDVFLVIFFFFVRSIRATTVYKRARQTHHRWDGEGGGHSLSGTGWDSFLLESHKSASLLDKVFLDIFVLKIKMNGCLYSNRTFNLPLQECPSQTLCGTRMPYPLIQWRRPGTGSWWEAACRSMACCLMIPACFSALPETWQEKFRPTHILLLPVSTPPTEDVLSFQWNQSKKL